MCMYSQYFPNFHTILSISFHYLLKYIPSFLTNIALALPPLSPLPLLTTHLLDLMKFLKYVIIINKLHNAPLS